eukprot:3282412-Amphidinium_carterae.1
MTNRKRIQEAAQNDHHHTYEKPPPSGSRVGGGGQYICYKTQEQYDQESMTDERNRTKWAVLFHM